MSNVPSVLLEQNSSYCAAKVVNKKSQWFTDILAPFPYLFFLFLKAETENWLTEHLQMPTNILGGVCVCVCDFTYSLYYVGKIDLFFYFMKETMR